MKGFVVTILGLNKDRSVLFLSWDLRLALQETRTRTAIILSDSESVNSTVQKVNKLQRRSVSDKTQKLQIFKWWKWKKIRRESIGHKKQAKVITLVYLINVPGHFHFFRPIFHPGHPYLIPGRLLIFEHFASKEIKI